MGSPLVSIVVPNYNHGAFLDARLASIESQTYSPIEIIVLDDCSSDGSDERLQQFSADNPQVVYFERNETNSGSAIHQWFKGVSRAKGQYIWLAETDDWCESDFIQTMVEAIQQFPNTSVAYCHSRWIDETGQDLGELAIYSPDFDENLWLESGYLDGNNVNRRYMPFRNIIRNASSALFDRRHLLAALTGFQPKTAIDDWRLYVEVFSDSGISFCNKTLNHCRLHANNHSRALSRSKYRRHLRARVEILRMIKERYYPQETSVKNALSKLWRYRNKYAAVDELAESAGAFGRLGLYGFNDLSKHFIDNSVFKPVIVFDRRAEKSSYRNVSLEALSSERLQQLDSVIIMSLAYKDQMAMALKQAGFEGQVICINEN